jgi:hypothetical protein
LAIAGASAQIYSWDVDAEIAKQRQANPGAAPWEDIGIDYAFDTVDDSLLAVALTQTSSLAERVKSLRGGKASDLDGPMAPHSGCTPGSCIIHDIDGSKSHPINEWPPFISLIVMCTARSVDCNVQFSPPTLQVRAAQSAWKKLVPSSFSLGDLGGKAETGSDGEGAYFSKKDIEELQKQAQDLAGQAHETAQVLGKQAQEKAQELYEAAAPFAEEAANPENWRVRVTPFHLCPRSPHRTMAMIDQPFSL